MTESLFLNISHDLYGISFGVDMVLSPLKRAITITLLYFHELIRLQT